MVLLNKMTSSASPNFNDRDPAVPLRYIVLHYTGMESGNAALQRLCDPTAEVSAHYLLQENGTVISLVDEGKRAWHAGKSWWRGITDLNSSSIGIELVNPGHQYGYLPFPAAQITSLVGLLRDIIQRHGLEPRHCLLAHSDIAPERKEDPGEMFPWRKLAEQGLGLWPDDTAYDGTALSDLAIQETLRQIGYNCPLSGDYDRATRACLLAFQRRFHPENLTGTPEAETLRRLLAVSELWPQEK
jgi:N-acetylmuramoyl-L-alanine amidase